MADSIAVANDSVVYRLEGQVVDATTGLGMDGITVDLGDAEGQSGDLVAHAKTNPLGEFTIEITSTYYQSLFLDRQPALNFRLYQNGQLPQPTITWTPSTTTAHLRIAVKDLSRGNQNAALMVVRGRVVDVEGNPLSGQAVTAYDQTITTSTTNGPPIIKENAVGTATTDSQGRYRITYDTTKLLRQGTLHADLVVRVRTSSSQTSTLVAESKPLCHAPTTAIVDLVAGNVALRGKSEYDRVRAAVISEIGAGSIAKIVDTDIPYLACTVEQPENLVRTLVQAHVLADLTTLPPAPLYGILRQGFPADRIAFLSLRPQPMLDALDRSIAANIVPASAATNFRTALENQMIDFALTPRSPAGGSALGEILPIALSDLNDRKEFVRTLITHNNDSTFWTTLSGKSQFTSTEIATLQRIFQWGVLTRYHIPLVIELEARFANATIQNVRDLARYDEDGWYAILNQAVGTTIVGAPADIPGATSNEKLRNYAKILERTIETAFPTAVIARRIQLEPNSTSLTTFFNNNATFDFKSARVATFLATTPGAMTGVSDVAGTTSKLKSLERVFRLTPRYAEMKPLLDAGLDSAHRIHNLGRTRFLARMTGPKLTAKRVEQLYGRACWVAGAATALFGKYSGQLNNVPMFSLPNLANGSPDAVAKAADWSKLFGSPDACACEHCRSVYSPAAYLVDLLEFLDRHDTKLLTGAASPNPQYFTLRDLLIGDLHNRPNPPIPCRPDIAHIELSCENTNTTLPYIDLVNEILEMVVANIADEPDHAWPNHIPIPLLPEDEDLLAEPQIIVPDAHRGAYMALRNAVHPFDMPWDFWAVEARTYLEHLGFPRHTLLEFFIDTTNPQPSEVGDKLARERLRLSKYAWQIITNNVASPPPSSQSYWGFPGDPLWIAKLSKVPRFLQQSGLTYEELRELLETAYLPSTVTLTPAEGCEIDAKVLNGLTEANLAGLHRFLRLRLHAGLTISEMDRVLVTFGETETTNTLVRHTADLLALKEQFGLSVSSLLAFWGNMGTASNEWSKSIYEEVFLTPPVLKLSADFKTIPTNPAGTLANHASAIQRALGITASEFALLTSQDEAEKLTGLNCVVTGSSVCSVPNLSRLYRVVTLARALNISLAELLILRSLSGLNVLQGDEPGNATPNVTRRFVKLAHQVHASALTTGDLQFLARHLVPANATGGMDDASAGALALELEALVATVKLGATIPDSIDQVAPPLEQRIDDAIAAKLADVWSIDASGVDYLLANVLREPIGSPDSAISLFRAEPDAGTLVRRKTILRRLDKVALLVQRLKLGRTEWSLIYPVGETTDWTDLNTIPLERKDAAVDYLPQFERLLRFIDLAALRDVLPNKADTIVAIKTTINALTASSITVDEFFTQMAAHINAPRDDVKFLMEHGFGYSGKPPSQCDCLEERALLCMSRALAILTKLRASAAQVSHWCDLDAADSDVIAEEIKQVTRKHYEESTWVEAARGIRDGLREKQRDALVHYLVSKQNLDGPNALFHKHLIDVEMSACQLTSRIKMAIGSVQTFVQRAFLGLMSETVTLDEDAAQEWSWMKNYRVWEANRKIFLYPENWIEPELRDDKTPFFRTLESRLLQGEITSDASEAAYLEYLQSLHEVARLEIAAICREFDDSNPNDRIDLVHVIARTQAAPHRYYYRQRVDSQYWTAWEKVDIDIQGDHLVATIWNRRLYLFWPVFGSATSGSGKDTVKQTRIDLAWTHRDAEKFVTVKTTKSSTLLLGEKVDPKWVSLIVENSDSATLTLRVLVSLFGTARVNDTNRAAYAVPGDFVLSVCTGKVETPLLSNAVTIGWAPYTAAPENAGFVEYTRNEKNSLPTNLPGHDELSIPVSVQPGPNGPPVFAVLLGATPQASPLADLRYAVVVDRKANDVMTPFALRNIFMYEDPKRVFFAKFFPNPDAGIKVWVDPSKILPTGLSPVDANVSLDLDAGLKNWADEKKLPWQPVKLSKGVYRFQTFYHPYVCDYTRALARDGIDGLLRWPLQGTAPLQNMQDLGFFATQYVPNTDNVATPYPVERVEFSFGAAYSQYNWELFFHAPFLIATRLTQNSRYEDADKWYRYIFDPTGGAPGSGPERFWYVKPFRENLSLASIQKELETLAAQSDEAQQIKDVLEAQFDSPITQDLVAQIHAWREKPFQPHVIARMRPIAYQKSVVMKYIDNLLLWGDSLFRRETIEAINEATQLYILAQDILGDRPRIIKTKDIDPKTYAELEPNIDAFSNALVEIESLVPPPPNPDTSCPRHEPPPVMRLYFCVPPNENMLRLWDTVEDRLFKIRHCMDIEGNVRQLPLFEPPIDPALLVRAAAQGLDIATMLLELNAPLPLYRFAVLLPKAMEFAGSVIGMGATLLSILEKRDGEDLAHLRATQEVNMLRLIRTVRQRQINEATETLEGLRRSRNVVETRRNHYANLEYTNTAETLQEVLSGQALLATFVSGAANALAGVVKVFPQVAFGTATYTEFGGEQLAGVLEIAAQGAGLQASVFGAQASMTGTQAGYQRRAEDWSLQVQLADRELDQIDKQILAAEIRLDIATKELANHEVSVTNAEEVETHLRTKFTNTELYVWLLERAKTVYFQGYKLAYQLAKRAERAFNFELAETSSFVTADHWDNVHQGLMAGERLQQDLRRMDAAFLEQNKREYEITKHVSLAEVDPDELMKLRGGGTCTVSLLEGHFDQDWRGHYLRRIKAVALTVPVTNAPYGSVNCQIGISSNNIRKDDRSNGSSDFYTDYTRAESILTSGGQQDSGMFELVFRDERYLPFEGAGAVSTWDISLQQDGNRFELTTIHDVVMHLRYTARHKGATALNSTGLKAYRLFSAKTDFPAEWHAFVEGIGAAAGTELKLPIALHHFQMHLGKTAKNISSISLYARRVTEADPANPLNLTVHVFKPNAGAATATPTLAKNIADYGTIVLAKNALTSNEAVVPETANGFAPWKLVLPSAEVGLDDIWVVCEYTT